MKKKNKPFLILTGLLIIGGAVWIGAAVSLGFLVEKTEEFRESYVVENGTSVVVKNRDGGTTVTVWEKDEIEVYALKKTHWGEEELDKVDIIVTTGTDFYVKTDYVKKFARVSVDLRISVPRNVTVSKVSSSNGNIYIEGTRGELTVSSSNGKVTLKGHTGDVTADTDNGKLHIRDVTGNVNAGNSNGKITIRNVTGEVWATSSNGDIVVEDAWAVRKVKTSNGDIDIEFSSITADVITIKTRNGDIKVSVPADINATVEMRTSNGDLDFHGFNIQMKGVYYSGDLGSGGPEISVETHNGDIDLYGRGAE